ncbi:carbohydrate ABC transporter permease [Planosporangium thailandense]|uniref:Carbohydrate ABC transporter permease n=1 Tax=Planosporangium thailandense TaxID=765197 RepID=A0ABX0XZU6_9ACTN|nr:carbohydrate ABC transporter permease [Planosporangium thailandense]NJC70718.1 carbohydrate ABC transporter permease [Planosporangium thailandense]
MVNLTPSAPSAPTRAGSRTGRETATTTGTAAARRWDARTPLRLLVRILGWAVLVALVVVVVYPLIWMVLSSFKDNAEVFGHPWGLPSQLRWHNFVKAWHAGVLHYFRNSIVVTGISIITTTLISAWAAYGLTRVRMPFSQPVLLLVTGGLMLAPTVAIIPLFRLLQAIHIFDTYWALIVLYTAFRIPFTTFLVRAYMIDLPREVDEAALMDGATQNQAFWRITLPMCRPILVSAALLQALFAWNEYAFALVFISRDSLKTLPVGLVDMQSRLLTDWPVQLAGLTIAAVPMIVLFLIGQRQFLRGLTEGMGK